MNQRSLNERRDQRVLVPEYTGSTLTADTERCDAGSNPAADFITEVCNEPTGQSGRPGKYLGALTTCKNKGKILTRHGWKCVRHAKFYQKLTP